uniref:RING-type domain-containing protein n=1 Tax=Zea mays TaxID=4577 RepID=A0A804MQ70_MAIZE
MPRSACTRSWSVEELAAKVGDTGQAESSALAFVDPRYAKPPPDHACLGCRLRPAFVVLLPCRHLSLCGAAMPCPVCLCVRTGSVEAILC